jgi:hypothetical protein
MNAQVCVCEKKKEDKRVTARRKRMRLIRRESGEENLISWVRNSYV